MKKLFVAFSVAMLAVPVAQAGVNDTLPVTNPCSSGAPWRSKLIIPDMNGDGATLPFSICMPPFPPFSESHGVYAETIITCTSKERPGVLVDLALQIYEPNGANLAGTPPTTATSVCSLDPGESVTFITNSNIGAPWNPGGSTTKLVSFSSTVNSDCPAGVGFSGCLRHGSARVISTSKRVQCTALRLDYTAFCTSAAPKPVVKNISVFPKAPGKGD